MGKVVIVVESKCFDSKFLETLARAMVPPPDDWQNACMQWAGVSPSEINISFITEED